MAIKLQLRRGTSSENDSFTGDIGEVTVDTTNKTLRVHDGSNTGGNELQSKLVSGTNIKTIDGQSLLGSGNISINNKTITLSGDVSGSGTSSIDVQLNANTVSANELNVSGNGNSGQVLTSDGDGSLSWSDPSSDITISNDTSTDEERYLLHSSQTAGTVGQVEVSSTDLSYNPSSGQLTAPTAAFTSTGAMIMPVGTTEQRPASPVVGMVRFNTSLSTFEGYNGTEWVDLAAVGSAETTLEGDLSTQSGTEDLEEGTGTIDLME